MLDGKPIVLLDVDDVIAQCKKKIAQEASEFLGKTITDEDIVTWELSESFDNDEEIRKHYISKMEEKGWCASLEPFPGAVEGVKAIQEAAQVFFVTSPFHSEHWMHERRIWLKELFDVPNQHIIQCAAKFLISGDVFVDDKPEHVWEWQGFQRRFAFLWDRPHNRNARPSLTRMRSWPELLQFIRGMAWNPHS